LRRLLGVLRGPSASAGKDLSERPGLTPAASLSRLDEVLDAVRAAGLPVTLMVDGDPGALPAGIDLTAYRIVQEALTNTLRHAPGSQACVRVSYSGGAVTVQVSDTGQPDTGQPDTGQPDSGQPDRRQPDGGQPDSEGPDGEGRARGASDGAGLGPGYGLAGIAERVASCGGSLTVGPVPAGGFAVTARLPVR
jgi:signal transduction histidine kinase